MAQVVDGADDGQAGTHVGLEEELHAALLGHLLEVTVVLIIAGRRNLVGCHHVDIMIEEVAVESGHIGRSGAVDKDTVEDVHADDLVAQTLDVALGSALETLAHILRQGNATAVENSVVTAGHTHHVEQQALLLLELLLLQADLLQKLTAHGAHTADEEVEHLVLREEERIMDGVERLAQAVLLDDERDVGLAGALSAGDDTDTASAEGAEQLAGDAGRALHVLAHNGHSGQTALGLHAEHAAVLNLLPELLVEHAAGFVRVAVLHTDAGVVLRRGLRHHEDRDAVLGQRGEDALIHTDHAHHGQAAHGDETGALDGGDALDALVLVQLNILLDDGALSLGVEGILDEDGDILSTHGVNGGRINHFGAEVAKLHGLHIRQLGNDVSRRNNLRVGRHEAVHVGPDLQHLGIERRSDDAGGVVAAAAPQIGDLAALHVGGNEAAHDGHLGQGLERFLDQRDRALLSQDVTVALLGGLDEAAGVIPLGSFNHSGHDAGRDTLAVGHDGGLRLGRKVADEVNALVDALELVEQCMHRLHKGSTTLRSYDSFDHGIVAPDHIAKRLGISPVAGNSLRRSADELVSDAAQGTHHDNHLLTLALHDALHILYAFHGTDAGSAKLQYFHFVRK